MPAIYCHVHGALPCHEPVDGVMLHWVALGPPRITEHLYILLNTLPAQQSLLENYLRTQAAAAATTRLGVAVKLSDVLII